MSKHGERLRKGVTGHIEGIPAELGRQGSTGAYTVPTGQLNEVYARLYGDPNNLVTALDLISSRKARLPVRLQLNTSGRYVVIGIDPLPANEFLGADAASGNVPPVRGSAVNAIWESYQFNPGRIHALNGSDLQVFMEPIPYGDSDLGGISGNLTTIVGMITSGKKAWIAVSVNPTTNVLSFTKGTEYGLPVAIGTRAFATAVVVPDGEIPLWAYLLRADATYIPVQAITPDSVYFVDRRSWLQVPENTFAVIQTTNNTQTTLASIAVAEASLLTITGTFSGVKSDYSAAITGTFVAGVRRATAGNATLVGVTVTSNEDSGGTPSFTVDADTGTQTARLRIQGISAETWNWSVKWNNLVT